MKIDNCIHRKHLFYRSYIYSGLHKSLNFNEHPDYRIPTFWPARSLPAKVAKKQTFLVASTRAFHYSYNSYGIFYILMYFVND